ncbi:MAG: hypothetical protein AAB344_05195, partial [Bacteroidota bacterium]
MDHWIDVRRTLPKASLRDLGRGWCMGVMKGLSLLLLLLFVSSHSRAQDFNWNLTTKSGEEYSRVALERLSSDTLYFLHKSNYPDWIVADSIVQLRRGRRGAILPGTLIGAAGGGAL